MGDTALRVVPTRAAVVGLPFDRAAAALRAAADAAAAREAAVDRIGGPDRAAVFGSAFFISGAALS